MVVTASLSICCVRIEHPFDPFALATRSFHPEPTGILSGLKGGGSGWPG